MRDTGLLQVNTAQSIVTAEHCMLSTVFSDADPSAAAAATAILLFIPQQC